MHNMLRVVFLRYFRLSMCLAVAALLASCASAKSVVVLMPDDTDKVGAIEVTTKGGKQVVDKAEFGVTIMDAAKPPTQPMKVEQPQIRKLFGEAIDARPMLPKSYLLYFVSNSADLTPESSAVVPAIISDIKSRPTIDISIIGHTDTVGTKEYNFKLSTERAEAVYKILAAAGLSSNVSKDSVDVRSHGKEDLLVKTPDNVDEPRNRRVEVVVR
ncbi:MAG: OmpA family protein [Nitrospirae bacterium]|nr:OmpA family protein [Nitrospirota bacterium]